LLHDAAADLVVTEHVTGPSLAEHLAAGEVHGGEVAGRAIARLHGAPLIVGPRRDLAGHVTDLIRPQPRALAAAVPELADQIAALLDGLAECLSTTGAAQEARPVHRDLHPRQLIVQRDGMAGSVVLLDWDLAAQGDPALDVGNLRGWLHHRHPADRAGAAARTFEDGYAELGDLAALDRADPYTAFTRLRLAVKMFRLDGPAALPVVRYLLGGASSLLAEEHLHAAV
jgi:aminoglycoside phosphotransferase (APT) family kinase protein